MKSNLGQDKLKSIFDISKLEFARLAFFSLLFFLFGFACGINPCVILFLILLAVYSRFIKLNVKSYNLLNFSLLFLLIFTLSHFIIRKNFSVYYIPFAAVPMLSTLLFGNLGLSLLITLATSVAVASISNYSLPLLLLFLISGMLSSLLLIGARKRTTIIRAGLITGIVQVAALIFINRFWLGAPYRYLLLLLNGLASSIIVLGILPIFEYLFKTATNISLLELADFNHPLLRRMTLEAPGTYHHSLVVGNLAESACQAIGANSLLARIGAYYHDIGKLQKPEYFSENQPLKDSKHDVLTPTMSKLIIMNHVKEGEELAKKHKLTPLLVDFISQHHGNSLVYYFYRRALEGLEEDQEVKEEGFRYPGPKPGSKETAVVLLADSVEAATRALREPSPAKIAEAVHKVINNKFIDGQLDECDLTLKELEKISAVFIRILSGIYHSRISYPDEPKAEPR